MYRLTSNLRKLDEDNIEKIKYKNLELTLHYNYKKSDGSQIDTLEDNESDPKDNELVVYNNNIYLYNSENSKLYPLNANETYFNTLFELFNITETHIDNISAETTINFNEKNE